MVSLLLFVLRFFALTACVRTLRNPHKNEIELEALKLYNDGKILARSCTHCDKEVETTKKNISHLARPFSDTRPNLLGRTLKPKSFSYIRPDMRGQSLFQNGNNIGILVDAYHADVEYWAGSYHDLGSNDWTPDADAWNPLYFKHYMEALIQSLSGDVIVGDPGRHAPEEWNRYAKYLAKYNRLVRECQIQAPPDILDILQDSDQLDEEDDPFSPGGVSLHMTDRVFAHETAAPRFSLLGCARRQSQSVAVACPFNDTQQDFKAKWNRALKLRQQKQIDGEPIDLTLTPVFQSQDPSLVYRMHAYQPQESSKRRFLDSVASAHKRAMQDGLRCNFNIAQDTHPMWLCGTHSEVLTHYSRDSVVAIFVRVADCTESFEKIAQDLIAKGLSGPRKNASSAVGREAVEKHIGTWQASGGMAFFDEVTRRIEDGSLQIKLPCSQLNSANELRSKMSSAGSALPVFAIMSNNYYVNLFPVKEEVLRQCTVDPSRSVVLFDPPKPPSLVQSLTACVTRSK